MFDLSLPELGVIGLIALVVLGPERLPKVARFTGLWVRRARAQWYSVKSELERELEAEELQRSLRNVREEAEDFSTQIRAAGEETRKDFESMREALNDARRARPADARIDDLVADGDRGTGEADLRIGHDTAQHAPDAPRADMDTDTAPSTVASQKSSDDGQR